MLIRAKSRLGRYIEIAAWALDAAIGLGMVSFAAVAVATGKFALAGILALIAVGLFLRFKRRRKNKNTSGNESQV